MTEAEKDPWLTLGKLRDDLKQARAELRKGEGDTVRNALRHIERALGRVGDGTINHVANMKDVKNG